MLSVAYLDFAATPLKGEPCSTSQKSPHSDGTLHENEAASSASSRIWIEGSITSSLDQSRRYLQDLDLGHEVEQMQGKAARGEKPCIPK